MPMNDLDQISSKDPIKILSNSSDRPKRFLEIYELGNLFQSKRHYRKSLIFAKQALNLSTEISNQDHQLTALINIGCIYFEMSQLKKAMKFFQDALSIDEELEYKETQGMLHAIMGISYWRKGDWLKAINFFEKALLYFPNSEINKEMLVTYRSIKIKCLMTVMFRGIETLKNRIEIAKIQQDPKRILLPSFAMVPLVFFTGGKESISHLLETIVPLARQLKNDNILSFIPRLKKIMAVN
jgi:tetratricopeptide (TPR) repeat protein